MSKLQKEKFLTFFSHKKETILDKSAIIYVITGEKHRTKIHTFGGDIYDVRIPLHELEKSLGNEFIKIRRNALVRATEVESLTDSLNLKNGVVLKYTKRQKKRIISDIIKATSSESPNEESVLV